MIRQFLVGFAALLGLSGSVLWGSDPRSIQLRWGELLPRIENRKVALVLPGGTHIEGKVEGVEAEGLHLRVTRTSDRKVLPKGSQLIPRESVSVLRVNEDRVIARPLCALGGAGVIAAWVAARDVDTSEGPAVYMRPVGIVGGGILGAIGGYYTGKLLDRKVTEIHIVREDGAGSER